MKRFFIIALVMLFASAIQAAPIAAATDSLTIAHNDSIEAARTAELTEKIHEIVHTEIAGQIPQQKNTFVESLKAIEHMAVPIFAIVCPFTMVCIIIYIIAKNETKRRRMKYDMVEKAIDKGIDIPEYVFYQNSKEKQKNSSVNTSIVLIAVGFAVSMFFVLTGDLEVAALASMIFLIGLGKLIVYIFDKKQKKEEQTERSFDNTQEDAQQD